MVTGNFIGCQGWPMCHSIFMGKNIMIEIGARYRCRVIGNLTVTEYVVAVIYGFKLLSRMYELDGKWYWETDEPTHWFPIDPTNWFPIPEPPKE